MPTRAIKVWNQSASAWENVGIEAPSGGGLDAATASATYLRQDTASATYLPISASATLGGGKDDAENIIAVQVFG